MCISGEYNAVFTPFISVNSDCYTVLCECECADQWLFLSEWRHLRINLPIPLLPN